jgi:hypothetical protein
VVLDPDDSYADFRRLVDGYVERGFAPPHVREHLVWATAVPEALDALEAAFTDAAR